MFNFRRIPINRVVEKIAELGTPSLVLLVAIGRIEPFFQSRLLIFLENNGYISEK